MKFSCASNAAIKNVKIARRKEEGRGRGGGLNPQCINIIAAFRN